MFRKSLACFLLIVVVLNTKISDCAQCEENYKKIACYKETGYGETLLNLRGLIEWKNFKNYLQRLTCECYAAAKNSSVPYKYFGLRYYGICIGFQDVAGLKSAASIKCINENFGTCTISGTSYCVGEDQTDLTFQMGVDGGYSQWSSFSSCSVTCGGGHSQRTRQCDAPAPVANGKTCNRFGAAVETKSCTLAECQPNVWSDWTPCTHTCGGGLQKRTKPCSNDEGFCEETKKCVNNLCEGPSGIAKAKSLIETYLNEFHESEYPDKKQSGKFYRAIFHAQDKAAEAFIADDTSLNSTSSQERLQDLEAIFKISVEGGSFQFGRAVLGKLLLAFIQTKIKDGIAIDDISKEAGPYLKKLKDDIGQAKFNRIIPSIPDSTLVFVIDTTGSMRQEIYASKAIARAVIKDERDFDVDYILSPFNDPNIGPVTYRSEQEKTLFLADLDKLPSNGGRDCPEPSFEGMMNALNYEPKYGSPVFVFTDATAKDDTLENVEMLKQKADLLASKIYFFTNVEGCKSGNKRGIKTFEDIASYTSGQIYPLTSAQELLKYRDVASASLKRDTTLVSGHNIETVNGKSIYFKVENQMSDLLVSICASVINGATQVKLTAPSGQDITVSQSLLLSKLFEVEIPENGTWALHLPSSSGTFDFIVEAVANEAIDFSYDFIYTDDSGMKSKSYSLHNPIKDVNNLMTVQVGGFHLVNMNSITIDIIDDNGDLISANLPLTLLSEGTLQLSLVPPNKAFKVQMSGNTNKDAPFQRISHGLSHPATVFIRAISAGKAFTMTSGLLNEIIKLQVLLFGSAKDVPIYFECSATLGKAYISPKTVLKDSGYIQISYDAPSSVSKKGTVDTLSVKAGQDTVYTFSILII